MRLQMLVESIEAHSPMSLGAPERELVVARGVGFDDPSEARWLAPRGTWRVGAFAALEVPDAPVLQEADDV